MKKNDAILIRLDEELKRESIAKARREGKSLAFVIRDFLEWWVYSRKPRAFRLELEGEPSKPKRYR